MRQRMKEIIACLGQTTKYSLKIGPFAHLGRRLNETFPKISPLILIFLVSIRVLASGDNLPQSNINLFNAQSDQENAFDYEDWNYPNGEPCDYSYADIQNLNLSVSLSSMGDNALITVILDCTDYDNGNYGFEGGEVVVALPKELLIDEGNVTLNRLDWNGEFQPPLNSNDCETAINEFVARELLNLALVGHLYSLQEAINDCYDINPFNNTKIQDYRHFLNITGFWDHILHFPDDRGSKQIYFQIPIKNTQNFAMSILGSKGMAIGLSFEYRAKIKDEDGSDYFSSGECVLIKKHITGAAARPAITDISIFQLGTDIITSWSRNEVNYDQIILSVDGQYEQSLSGIIDDATLSGYSSGKHYMRVVGILNGNAAESVSEEFHYGDEYNGENLQNNLFNSTNNPNFNYIKIDGDYSLYAEIADRVSLTLQIQETSYGGNQSCLIAEFKATDEWLGEEQYFRFAEGNFLLSLPNEFIVDYSNSDVHYFDIWGDHWNGLGDDCHEGLFGVIFDAILSLPIKVIKVFEVLIGVSHFHDIIMGCIDTENPFGGTLFEDKQSHYIVSGDWDNPDLWNRTTLNRAEFRIYTGLSAAECVAIFAQKGIGLKIETDFTSIEEAHETQGSILAVTSDIRPMVDENINPCDWAFDSCGSPVTPASGDPYTNFTFNAVYSDPGGKPPASVDLKIDKWNWVTMTEEGGAYSTGVAYSHSESSLPSGTHTVIMRCSVTGCDDIIIGPFSFTVGMPSSPGLTFMASPDNICAFTEESRLTVTLLDDHGNPIVGEHISIFPHLGNASTCGLVYDISNQGVTDVNGQVTAKFKSTCAGDFAIVADPDNYPARSVLVDVDACSCPYTISIIPTIDIPCGGVVSYRLKPRILDSNGDCLESGKVIWDILNCSGAWFEFGGVNYGSHYELVADGIICDDLSTGWPLLKYSGPGSCDATIRVCIEGFSGCCSSFPIHLDPQCPPVAQPIWQTGPFSIDSEWGKTIQFSPDGKYLISFDTKLYETKNYTIKCSYAGNNRSISHAFSSNGEIVASIVPDYIFLNNTNSCEQISGWTCEPLDDPNVVVWSDNRNRMAISGWDEAVVKIIEPPCNTITSLSTGWAVYDLSWKGNMLAAVGDNRGIKVWNATTDSYSLIYTYPQTGCAVEFYSCDFSNDGNKLAVIGESRSCGTFNLYVITFSGNSISRIDSASYCYNNDVTGVSWSPDGNMLLITGYNNCAKIINTTSASLPVVSELNISNNWSSCDWSSNGLIGVIDGSIKIFTPFDKNPPFLTNLSPLDEYVTSDSQIIVSGTLSDEYSLDPNSVKMNINGGEWANIYDTSWSFGCSVNLSEGMNVIAFQYADRIGHWGYDTLNVTRSSDTLGPVIVGVEVDDFVEIGSQVHITAKVLDQWSGVDSNSVVCILHNEKGDQIDSIFMAAVIDDTVYACNWETGGQCEGSIRITIRAVDKRGNIAIRASAAYFGLYDFPEILTVTIDPLIPNDTTSPLISLGWMDCSNLSQAIAYYAYGDTSGVWQQKNMAIVDHGCKVSLPKRNMGWMYFRILLTDVYAHNTISPIDSYFIVDVSPPQAVLLLEPYDNRHINNPKPTLSWLSISDPGGSGIEYYSVELADNVMFTGSQTSIVSAGNSWQPSSDLAFGQYHWRVWATDKSGNSGDKSEVWSLFIDIRPPLQPDSVYVNEGLIPAWTNDSVFVIRYVESDEEFLGRTILSKVKMGQLALNDTSGISVAYYKLNTPPVENGDFMGVTPYNPFELVVHNRDVLYIWLKDGAGNVDYRNWASIDLLFDNAPVVGVHASIVRDTLYAGDTLKVTWNSGTDGEGSGRSDIYDVYAKIGTSEWQELVVGLDDITELDTIPDFVNEDSVWVFLEVSTRDQVGNYDSTGVAEDSIFILRILTDVNDHAKPLPDDFYLGQNHPNPFNPTTTIEFSLPKASEVELEIFNIAGQKVATLVNLRLEAGYHSVTWDSRNNDSEPLASGIYLYRLKADTFVETKKMMLLK